MREVYDRASGALVAQPQFGEAGLRLLYGGRAGLALANGLISRRWVSRLMAWPNTWRRSAAKIPAFVARFGIDLDDYPQRDYASFADFFVRDLRPGARPVDENPSRLIAPADAKLLAARVGPGSAVRVKGVDYRVAELLGREPDRVFSWCLVFRLTVDECHRYVFVDDCEVVDSYAIAGRLHTVGGFSDGKVRVLARNHRVVTALDTRSFGRVVQVEVGAMLVGRVVNHPVFDARRGQEKGFFAYGGSTIVLLTGELELDADVAEMSARGVETRVRRGESVASRP